MCYLYEPCMIINKYCMEYVWEVVVLGLLRMSSRTVCTYTVDGADFDT